MHRGTTCTRGPGDDFAAPRRTIEDPTLVRPRRNFKIGAIVKLIMSYTCRVRKKWRFALDFERQTLRAPFGLCERKVSQTSMLQKATVGPRTAKWRFLALSKSAILRHFPPLFRRFSPCFFNELFRNGALGVNSTSNGTTKNQPLVPEAGVH